MRRGNAEAAVLAWILASIATAPALAASAQEPPALSLSYSVTSSTGDDAVRVANVGDIAYPRIAIDESPSSPFYGTIYVIGAGQGNGSCNPLVVARSLDRGRTFESPRPPGPCLPSLSNDVVVGRGGTLFVSTWGPSILRSVDGGFNWTALAALDNSTAPKSLAIDRPTGTVYVTWGPRDDPWGIEPGPILVASSGDDGGNWTAPLVILPNGTEGARPQIAAFADHVMVAYTDTTLPRIAAVASSDGGMSWENVTPISPAAPCEPWLAPSVAASPRGIFAVGWNAVTGSQGCAAEWGNATESWVSISRDGGRTFGTPVRAGEPPGWIAATFGDTIVFDNASRLYVTWHSIAPNWTSATVYAANSTDLGSFDSAGFNVRLRALGGNSTAQENLAAGPDGIVYLVYVVLDMFDPGNPETGVFVRPVTGEAEGNVELRQAVQGSIEVDVRDAATNDSRARVAWNGSSVAVPGLQPGTYAVRLHIGGGSYLAGTIPAQAWSITRFTVVVGEGPSRVGFPWTVAAGIAAAIVVAVILVGIERAHTARGTVLQTKVRLLMFEYVRDNPGASFSRVRDALGLQNGVAAYHLGLLEKQGLVHSESRRRKRWYYPNGEVSMWKEVPLSPLQASLLEQVKHTPGIRVRELARAVTQPVSSVAYNVKTLTREGVLRVERVGRSVRCFPVDGGVVGRAGPATGP